MTALTGRLKFSEGGQPDGFGLEVQARGDLQLPRAVGVVAVGIFHRFQIAVGGIIHPCAMGVSIRDARAQPSAGIGIGVADKDRSAAVLLLNLGRVVVTIVGRDCLVPKCIRCR